MKAYLLLSLAVPFFPRLRSHEASGELHTPFLYSPLKCKMLEFPEAKFKKRQFSVNKSHKTQSQLLLETLCILGHLGNQTIKTTSMI